MDFNEAGRMVRDMKKRLRATDALIAENAGYIGQIGRLAYEYADGGPSFRGKDAEADIVGDLIEARTELEAVTKRLARVSIVLNKSREAIDESQRRRAESARRMKI